MMKDLQKKEAIERLKALQCDARAKELLENGKVMIFENGHVILEGLNIKMAWAVELEDDKILEQIKRIEEVYGLLVYAVVETDTEFGRLYDFFHVSKYEEEWEMDRKLIKQNMIFSYCYNQSIPEFSEFRTIQIENVDGNLYRIA